MDFSSETDDDMMFVEAVNELNSPDLENNNEITNSRKSWFPVRYLIVSACAIASMAMSLIRMCTGMAIVCMTNHTAILATHVNTESSETPTYCPADSSVNMSYSMRHFSEDGPFEWNDSVQSLILASYFWGYIITQFPGGIMVIKTGAKWTLAVAMLISSLLCLTIPFAATHAPVAVIMIINVGIGLSQGFIYPTIYYVVSRWAPKNERTRMLSVAVSGFAIGQMMVNSISASLCSKDTVNGWKYIYYLFGICGIIAIIIWITVIGDYPSEHRWVSFREANYIKTTSECCQQPGVKIKIPWRSIFTSAPFWASFLTEIIFTFKSNALQVDLPTYMKVIMNFDIKKNGVINSVPYVIRGAIGLFLAFAADFSISTGFLSVTSVRKIGVTAIAVASCAGLLGVTLAGCEKTIVIILLGIVISFDGFQLVAVNMNSLDLAPNFVGITKGLLNAAAGLGNLAAPSIIGLMITNNNSVTSWNNFFYITFGLIGFACFVYLIFGSGNVQPWNELKPSSTNTSDDENKEANHYMLLKEEKSLESLDILPIN